MKQKTTVYETVLDEAAVDHCAARVREFLKSCKLPKRDLLRYGMSAEEILFKSLQQGLRGASVRLITGVRLRRPYVTLEINGQAQNVFAGKEEQSVLGEGILRNLGLAPEYAFTGISNSYQFRIRRDSRNPFLGLILALTAAIALGFLGLLIPEGIRTLLLHELLTPLHDTFLNILGCIAGPMIFLSVAWGIYGIGDAATLKQIGKKILLGYVGTVYIVVLVLGWMCLPVFDLQFSGGANSGSELSKIFTMLLGVVPENIFSPFVNGNTLQIIFLAIVIGIALLFLGQKTNAVAKAVEQINYLVQFLIEFISKLVPYFIFIVLVKMIWSDMAAIFLNVAKLFLVFAVAAVLMIAGILCYTGIRNHIRPTVLLRKGLPTLLIAITTASSAAAFGTNMKACREEYGIDGTIASFGIPLGMVTFKPTTALSYAIMTLFFSEVYGVRISLSWVLMMIFAAGILALATPPIPGGAMASYTVLFTLLGIPPEALAIALACDTIFDFVTTGGDQFLIPFVLLNQAGKMGMVDQKVLRARKK